MSHTDVNTDVNTDVDTDTCTAPAKKYIAVQYDAATRRNLQAWAAANGFDLCTRYDGATQDAADFEFHTTVFCTTTEHRLANRKWAILPSGTAKVVDFLLLGPDKNIPALKIASHAIDLLRRHFARTHGMKDAWPEYCPHVTVSYAKAKVEHVPRVTLPAFALIFDRVTMTDVHVL
jgi:hypothetical protein